TVHEIAIAAEFAITARASEETDTYSLANCPALNTRAKGVDASDHFMSRYARPVDWKGPFHRAGIRVADTARLDLNAHLAGTGIHQRLHYVCEFSRFRYLDCSIRCGHCSSPKFAVYVLAGRWPLLFCFGDGAGSVLCRRLPWFVKRF